MSKFILILQKKKIWHILSNENIGYVAFKLQNWNTLRVYLFCEKLGIKYLYSEPHSKIKHHFVTISLVFLISSTSYFNCCLKCTRFPLM